MKDCKFNVGPASATVVYTDSEGKVQVRHIPRSSPNFTEVIKALTSDASLEQLLKALNPAKATEAFSHGEIQHKEGKLWFHGEVIHSGAAEKVLEFMRLGLDYKPLLRFLERLLANPSRNSREQFYKFLEHKNLPITPEGKVLAYKSVRSDFWSITGGGTKLVQGKVDANGRVYNGVGEVIRCQRGSVDDNVNHGCSHGLHVGSWEYVSTFGGSDCHRLVVEVDPADIVSVPHDCECQKVRTCAYRVVSLANGPLHSRVSEATQDKIRGDLETCDLERKELEQRQAELENELRQLAAKTKELANQLGGNSGCCCDDDDDEEGEYEEIFFTARSYAGNVAVRSYTTDRLDDPKLGDFVRKSLDAGLNVKVHDQDHNEIPLNAIV